MGSQFVKVYGREIKVGAEGGLSLPGMNIKDISEIKGLDSLANLKFLDLDYNQIPEDLVKKFLDELKQKT